MTIAGFIRQEFRNAWFRFHGTFIARDEQDQLRTIMLAFSDGSIRVYWVSNAIANLATQELDRLRRERERVAPADLSAQFTQHAADLGLEIPYVESPRE